MTERIADAAEILDNNGLVYGNGCFQIEESHAFTVMSAWERAGVEYEEI